MKWHFFISHASADKKPFVEPLVAALTDAGYDVWYDELSIEPGSGLRRSIDQGLAESAAGIVVLSPNFFAREWPQRELDSLTNQEINDNKKLFAIWLDIDRSALAKISPLLADKVAIHASAGLESVVRRLSQVMPVVTDLEIDALLDRYRTKDVDLHRVHTSNCLLNFHKLTAYYNAYDVELERAARGLSESELESNIFESKMRTWREHQLKALGIPNHVYLEPARTITAKEVEEIGDDIASWCNGTLPQSHCAKLFWELDEWMDADTLYVLYSLPNYKASPAQRDRLHENIANIGARRIKGNKSQWPKLLENLYRSLRKRRLDAI